MLGGVSLQLRWERTGKLTLALELHVDGVVNGDLGEFGWKRNNWMMESEQNSENIARKTVSFNVAIGNPRDKDSQSRRFAHMHCMLLSRIPMNDTTVVDAGMRGKEPNERSMRSESLRSEESLWGTPNWSPRESIFPQHYS